MRFGHHANPAADFCAEVAALALGDASDIDRRIERALDFRVGANADAVAAKARLREIAAAHGFDVTGEIAYAGQPVPRQALAALRSPDDLAKGRGL